MLLYKSLLKKIVFSYLFAFSSLLATSQQVEVIKFADLAKKMVNTNSSLTIFNFWATWCGPCVKELPYFDALSSKNTDLKVYLVSLDFKNTLNRVEKLVAKKSIQSEVLFLDETDPDTYMGKVSPNWSGAIPATLFINKSGETFFYEKAFTKEELEKIVKKYLN